MVAFFYAPVVFYILFLFVILFSFNIYKPIRNNVMNNSKRNKNMGPVVKRDVGKVITLINAFLLKHKIDSWFDV